MKKILFVILSIGIMTIVPTISAHAATISLSPEKINVIKGQELVVTFVVNPEEGEKTFTTKISFEYPDDILEVKSFTFANGWIPVVRENYDQDRKDLGVFMKTAGFPEGFSEPKIFGTVVLGVKAEGAGVIRPLSDSFVLDAWNNNILRGSFKEISVVAAHTDGGVLKLFANILALGTTSNIIAFFVLLIVMLILYSMWKRYSREDRSSSEK